MADEGTVQYAQWLHPKESKKEITQMVVNQYKKHVNYGDMVIDIGAHTGDSTLPYALAAGKEGLVLALEPNPYVFEILKINASLSLDKTHIEPLNFAATEEDGEFEFLYSDNGFCNGGNLSVIKNQKHHHEFKLKVLGKNLENYVESHFGDHLDKLSLIKVDTEGYDRFVLASLKKLIMKKRPILIAEVLKKLTEEERVSLYNLLAEDLGYKICYLDVSLPDLVGKTITKTDLMDWPNFDIICFPMQ